MAPLAIEIVPEAADEAREARIWYAQRSPTAATRFIAELDRAISEIQTAPQRWPAHLYGTRRYILKRFPFLIVYRLSAEKIQIIACQHAKRRPGYWRGRLGS